MKKYRIRFLLIIILLAVIVPFLVLAACKKIRLTSLFADRYDVQGVDVSHYQGEIDWNVLQKNDIDFAFIKATEGSSHVDKNFLINWEEASKTNMKIGAYHFFSFDSPAAEQARNYINTVGSLSGRLAPVIDIEYYGDKEANPPDVDVVREELQQMLDLLEEQYQKKPVLYTTYKVYKRYVKGFFDEYPLWIRNVYYFPSLDIEEQWTFWQYSDRSVLEGYEGREKYIDRDVFQGSEEELMGLICP